MNQLSTDEIMSLMDSARFDAAGQGRNVIRRFNQVVDKNYRLVDPTNPFVFLLEMACAGAANVALHHEVELRRRSPQLAQSMEDLYFHLTNRQYMGVFAVPSETNISMIIPIEDIMNNAVETDDAGVRVLTLGKNSVWTVGGYNFTLEYPIDFNVSPGGSLTMGFGDPAVPALHSIGSNIILPEPVNYQGYDSVRFTFPVKQMTVDSQLLRINRASAAVGSIGYANNEKFHYLRAFVRRTVNNVRVWVEILTTHNHYAYDPSKPTLLVRDLGGEVELTLPVIYHTMDVVGDEIRVDLYTTRAVNDLILSEFAEDQWTLETRDFDETDNNRYTAPFSRLNTFVTFSSDYTRNGRDSLSFEELRDRIMDVYYGNVDQPITNVNHELKLRDMGFASMKATDGVVERTFNATRNMPLPVDGYLSSPINVGVFNILLRPFELEAAEGVDINGPIATIRPEVLFKEVDGVIRIVGPDERAMLATMTGDVLSRYVSSANYLFTPFYNVIDSTTQNFELRVYNLDTPEVKGRQFIKGNPSLLLDLYTSSGLNLSRTKTGYVIHLATESGDTYKALRDDQLGIQLSFTPNGAVGAVDVLGTLINKDDEGNRIWEFVFDSNGALTSDNEMVISNFHSGNNGEVVTPMPLSTQLEIIYFVNDYPIAGGKRSTFDNLLNQGLVPSDGMGILRERVEVVFGERVENLWTGARPIVMPEDYEVYDHDMPKLYEKPEYLTDAEGNLVVTFEDGKSVVKIVHNIGDPKLDPVSGLPEYVYRRGETVYEAGVPVIKNPRTLTRQLDLVLFDGLFFFANDRSSVDYVNYVRRNIVQWSRDNMAEMNRQKLEETFIRFRPTNTIGTISCVVGEGGDVTIDARQSLTIEFMMTEMDWKNEKLKEALRPVVRRVIAEQFAKENIAVNVIESELAKQVPSSIMGISMSGLGGKNNYKLITMKDGSSQPSIRMKLSPLPNDEYTVEEDINILFIPHLPARSDK